MWENADIDGDGDTVSDTPYLDDIDVGLRELHKSIMPLAIGTNTGIQYYENLPLSEINQDAEAYVDYLERVKEANKKKFAK